MTTKQVLIIVGPTAVGKTDVACAVRDLLSESPSNFDGASLISADSAMVYRGFDIGSAKPSREELAQWPHELIDLCEPVDVFNAADFVQAADECVQRAWRQNKLPVIVGGTMLYVKRFVEGIAELPETDQALRAALTQRYETEGGHVLYQELIQQDPQAAEKIHPNNKQRLIRALEVCQVTSQGISPQWGSHADAQSRLGARLTQVGIFPTDRTQLHKRIEQRFLTMLTQGFLEEARVLFDNVQQVEGAHELPAFKSVGYRQAGMYLRGECDKEEFIQKAQAATRQLAKRQLTWMRNWTDLHPINLGEARALAQQIVKLVR